MRRTLPAKITEDKELKDKKQKNADISGSINSGKKVLEKTEEQIELGKMKVAALDKQSKQLEKDIVAQQETLAHWQEETIKAKQEAKSLQAEVTDKKASNKKELAEVQEKHDAAVLKLNKEVDRLETEKGILTVENKKLAEDNAKLEKSIKQNTITEAALLKAIPELKKILSDLETKQKENDTKYTKAKELTEVIEANAKTARENYVKEVEKHAAAKKKFVEESATWEGQKKKYNQEITKLKKEIDDNLKAIASVGRREQNVRNEEVRLTKLAKRLGVSLSM